MDDQNQPQPTSNPPVPPDLPSAPITQPVMLATSTAQTTPEQTEPVDSQAPLVSPQQPLQPQQNPSVPPPVQQAQTPETSKKKRKWPKIVLVIVVVIVSLFTILAVFGALMKPDLTLTEYKNSEFDYTILRPAKWSEDTKSSIGAKSTLFTDKIDKDKELYRAYMEISATAQKYPDSVSDADELFDQIQSSIKTELSGFAPTTTDNSDFKGNKARRLEGTYKSGSEVGKAIVLIILEPDGQAQALLLASPEKTFKTYEKAFNEIIESFNP